MVEEIANRLGEGGMNEWWIGKDVNVEFNYTPFCILFVTTSTKRPLKKLYILCSERR